MLEDSIVNGNKNKNTDIGQKNCTESKEDATKIIHEMTQLIIKL